MNKYITIVLMLLSVPALADSANTISSVSTTDLLTVFVSVVLILVLVALFFIFYALNVFKNYINPAKEKISLYDGFVKAMTASVPVEKEESILTDHDYDGIRELDNNLPPWWVYMFYATIVFAGVYIYYFHFSDNGGKLQTEEYNHEMVVAEKQKEAYMKKASNSIDENNVKLLSDAITIDKGKAIYIQNCAACHGGSGEGGVGPNLTDKYWLHGGGVKNIFKTIKYGVPEKGMISWKAQLSPSNIQEVTSFIISIQGTNPANAKASQGEEFKENEEVASN